MRYPATGPVTFPPLEELVYQALALRNELRRFTPIEYPKEACQVARLLDCIAAHLVAELRGIEQLTVPKQSDVARALSLGEVVRTAYPYVRYLRAAAAQQAPPAIQHALTQLATKHIPHAAKDLICLVRPQWTYNFAYRSLAPLLLELKPVLLDPQGRIPASDAKELVTYLWRAARQEAAEAERDEWDEEPPFRVAILSFPGLDTEQTFSYALLGHELAHHIDLSAEPRLSTTIARRVAVSREEVDAALGAHRSSTTVERVWYSVMGRIETAIRELLADLLATRMLGLSFFLAQVAFLKTITADWPGPAVLETGYPGIGYRLGLIHEELIRAEKGWSLDAFLRGRAGRRRPSYRVANYLRRYISDWGTALKAARALRTKPSGLDRLVVSAVKAAIPHITQAARGAIPSDRRARLSSQFFEGIRCLENELPPLSAPPASVEFHEVLSSACAYQLFAGRAREATGRGVEEACAEHRKTARLALKAIELLAVTTDPGDVQLGAREIARHAKRASPSVLSGQHIRYRMSLPVGNSRHLGVVPASRALIQGTSLDIRLGNWFAVARRTRLAKVDVSDKKATAVLLRGLGREEVYVALDKGEFVIHPGDFVLGTSLEFFSLPADLMAFAEGKSTIGRTGLLVATAAQVAPTFRGVIVLELSNAGTVPLLVRPGMPIAQLVFHAVGESVAKEFVYHGPSLCQIRP